WLAIDEEAAVFDPGFLAVKAQGDPQVIEAGDRLLRFGEPNLLCLELCLSNQVGPGAGDIHHEIGLVQADSGPETQDLPEPRARGNRRAQLHGLGKLKFETVRRGAGPNGDWEKALGLSQQGVLTGYGEVGYH